MAESKFNFVPFHHAKSVVSDNQEFRVTVRSKKPALLSFPKNHPETKLLIGKYLQFFVDVEQNILGWKVFEKGTFGELMKCMPVKDYKTGASRTTMISIAKPLRSLMHGNATFKKIPVERYRNGGPMEDGKFIYYITIPKKVSKEVKPVEKVRREINTEKVNPLLQVFANKMH